MRTLTSSFSGGECHNLNLGLVTKAKDCKVVGQKGKLGSHISCSQVSSHFGSWSPDGLLKLHRTIAEVKTHWIRKFLILYMKATCLSVCLSVYLSCRAGCNFLLLSLAVKGKKTLPVPCVTSSCCPWQQKENSK
jgi:hypothetical protein